MSFDTRLPAAESTNGKVRANRPLATCGWREAGKMLAEAGERK
jgi:hypothetical protein